jgi:hypothetical protein
LGLATVGSDKRIFAALNDGRILMLDENLDYVRYADDEWGNDPDLPVPLPVPKPWCSNRTMGHVAAFDLYRAPGSDQAWLYFAEYNRYFFNHDEEDWYRVGKVEVLNNPGTWDPYEFTAEERHIGIKRPIGYKPLLTRFFRYDDVDGDQIPEAYFLKESGTVYKDPASGQVRKFSNTCMDTDIFPLIPPYLNPKELGGHVFEYHSMDDYSVLDDFVIPEDPALYINTNNPDDWWYPGIGDNRIGGQVACLAQGLTFSYQGTSMATANLIDPADPGSGPVPHVVTGTMGGYVYVIRPGMLQNGQSIPSDLNYASKDFGWNVVGMDVGNLDEDPEDEIVIGTFVDDGNFQDWRAGDTKKNRGHVLILDSEPSNKSLTEIHDLDFDDVMGDGEGITSGVLGVKLDDVDGDGDPEIWVGDGAGYLYLFHKIGSTWRGFYRSPNLGAYPGFFNNIFPIKDANGRTTRLILASSGYIMAFDVDWQLL